MLLGLPIDRNLNCNKYVFSFSKKAGKRLSALARLSNFMSIKQRRVWINSFIESEYGYFSLILMFHSNGVNNKINNLDERSLRIFYNDNNSSFKDLLKKDNSFTVHYRNIQSLAIDLFNAKENLSNTIINDNY